MISNLKIYNKLLLYCDPDKREEMDHYKTKTLKSIKKEFARLKAKRRKFVLRYKKITKKFLVLYMSNNTVKMYWEKK